MKLIPGPSSPLLTKRVSDRTGFEIANVTYKKFPDGENYVRVEDLKDERFIVVNSIRSNDDLMYMSLIFDALEGKEIYAVIPYMGYARQDRAFLDGEAVSIRVISRIIESYAEKIYTVNIHSDMAKTYFKKLTELDAMKIIGEYYKGKDVVMLSPDKGSLERVKRAAETAGCDFDYLEKRRIDAEIVEINPKNLDVEGRDVVILDDIISTGGTVVTATKQLFGKAKKIEATCVHGLFVGNALNKLYSSGISEIKSTDTVESQVSVISVSELISEVLINEI